MVTVHGFAVSFVFLLNSEGNLKLGIFGSESNFCRKLIFL